MKKSLIILSLVLAVCMFGGAAVAEEGFEHAFQIIPIVPEGFDVVEEVWQDPYLGTLKLSSSKADKPTLFVVVAYNDSISHLTFNDETIGTDEVKSYIDSVAYDAETESAIPYRIENTGLGTGVVIFERATATEFYSIWRGYEVSLYAYNLDAEGNESKLTEDQVSLVMKFLTDMDFNKVVVDEATEAPAAPAEAPAA